MLLSYNLTKSFLFYCINIFKIYRKLYNILIFMEVLMKIQILKEMKELVLKVKYAAMEYDKIIEQKVDEYLAVVNRNN